MKSTRLLAFANRLRSFNWIGAAEPRWRLIDVMTGL